MQLEMANFSEIQLKEGEIHLQLFLSDPLFVRCMAFKVE